jgi:glycosyltransferase involved in cell wall biosynthesis
MRDTTLLVAGDGKATYRRQLQLAARQAGVADRVVWLGQVEDMRAFYSAVDLLCLSSVVAEGTSNVIAEAMACGRMVVATEVGDSAELIGDASMMARPGDPDSLAEVITHSVNRRGEWDMAAARSSIVSFLSADEVLTATERALDQAVAFRRARTGTAQAPDS